MVRAPDEHTAAHLLEFGLTEDADARLRLLPAAGLDSHLGDTERTVQHGACRIQVLDAVVRHVPFVPDVMSFSFAVFCAKNEPLVTVPCPVAAMIDATYSVPAGMPGDRVRSRRSGR